MQKRNIIIILAVAVIAVALAVIFLFPKYFPNTLKPNNQQNNEQSSLPEGWTYQKSQLCNVDIPLPPRAAPYITADRQEYWRFQENAQDLQGSIFFPNVAIAILQNPELGGSGYVAGSVVVSCKENTDKDSSQQAAQKYAAYLQEQSQNVPEEAKLTLTTKGKTNLWGKEVIVVALSGGMFNPEDNMYLFATPSFVYLISKPQHSTDLFVGQTTRQVLEGLKFR